MTRVRAQSDSAFRRGICRTSTRRPCSLLRERTACHSAVLYLKMSYDDVTYSFDGVTYSYDDVTRGMCIGCIWWCDIFIWWCDIGTRVRAQLLSQSRGYVYSIHMMMWHIYMMMWHRRTCYSADVITEQRVCVQYTYATSAYEYATSSKALSRMSSQGVHGV